MELEDALGCALDGIGATPEMRRIAWAIARLMGVAYALETVRGWRA